jgi:hypothetical protein
LWALVATVFLLWPGLGVNWFGAGSNPNASLAALSFSNQRLQYELTQFVPGHHRRDRSHLLRPGWQDMPARG